MNIDTIYPHPEDLGDSTAESSFSAGVIFACVRNGMSVAREARRLYAMSDEKLGQEGLTREDIPARLASLL